jgi:hypothetical protein
MEIRQGIGPLLYWRGGYHELLAEVDQNGLAKALGQ